MKKSPFLTLLSSLLSQKKFVADMDLKVSRRGESATQSQRATRLNPWTWTEVSQHEEPYSRPPPVGRRNENDGTFSDNGTICPMIRS